MIYNKLVRDRIPEIMRAAGKNPVVKDFSNVENDNAFELALGSKLVEEVNELLEASYGKTKLAEELADVLEVLDSMCEFYNIDLSALAQIKNEKKDKRGGFSKRLFLVSDGEGE